MTGRTFEFATASRVVVGPGRADELGDVVSDLGTRGLVCTGSHPDRHADLLARLSVPCAVIPVSGEPTVDMVRQAVAVARGHGADVVVAVGGGSVVDVGKAVAMLLGNGGDPLDYLEIVGRGVKITRRSIPFVAVPTTAGTGAEVTANAVISSPEHRIKASLRSPHMLPRVALVDPLLAVDCPPLVTASSGLDALTQCLEPFVSVRANPLTDGLAREGLRHAAIGLRRVAVDGTDIDARSDMAVCSTLGGMALANAKLGAVHGFAGVIGGVADVPHGMACAALLVPVVEANVRVLRARRPGGTALAKYEEVARLLTGSGTASIDEGVAWIRETVAQLGIPGLSSFGIGPEHATEVVTKAAKASSMQGNPVALADDDLYAIFAAAAAG